MPRQRQIDGGAGSHTPIIYDINRDGKDEMLAGTYMLDSSGKILWMIPFEPIFAGGGDDHIDGADVGPVGEDGRVVVAFPNNCVVADALSGEVFWKKGSDHGQVAYVRKLRRDLPGNQIIFSEKLNTRRLFDAQGNEIDCAVGNGTERDWWADGEGMHLWPIAESRLVDWDGSGEQDQFVGSLVLDRNGRCIGVGEWTACPLVDDKVWGSTVLQLRLNFNVTRARALAHSRRRLLIAVHTCFEGIILRVMSGKPNGPLPFRAMVMSGMSPTRIGHSKRSKRARASSMRSTQKVHLVATPIRSA